MKKTITAIAMLAGAVSAYSQGQIALNDYNNSFSIQLFQASSVPASTVSVSYGGFSGSEQQGNTSFDDNAGNSTYTGAPLSTGYSIELLAAPSAGAALSSLTPVAGTIANAWISGSGGGYWSTSTTATIPGTTTTATVAIAAWDSAVYSTLAAAEASGVTGTWGISDAVTTGALGFGSVTPPNLPAGLTSFSLANTVPEPSTVALGIVGASAFLMRLRRKL